MSGSPSSLDQRRLVAQLRSRSGLRQTMLATEVLAPPIALRGRRPRAVLGRRRPPLTVGSPDRGLDSGPSSRTD